MKIAFFVSSTGDTNLALASAAVLRKKGHQTIFISLTGNAENLIKKAAKLAVIPHVTLYDVLNMSTAPRDIERCTNKQIDRIMRFVFQQQFSQAFVGMPSEQNLEVAMQIAERIRHIPVVFASEFMFKPHTTHSIWKHKEKLQARTNLNWLVPLKDSQTHYSLAPEYSKCIGHLSIDNALEQRILDTEKIRKKLRIDDNQSFAFLSSTTKPVEYDLRFLEEILNELPNYPDIQLRLGLHPGIGDLDGYLDKIIKLYKKLEAPPRFQIILPCSWKSKFKRPEVFFDNTEHDSLFIFEEISGSDAAYTADKVMQAVPGALLNEAAVRGKPVYTQLSEEEYPCLPQSCFAQSLALFFNASPAMRLKKSQLGLNEEVSVGEVCTSVMLSKTS